MMFPKNKPWRSEKHRKLVATLSCAICNKRGPSQCAHINFGKSMGSKVSDILTFPACPNCHREHDQGGRMSRDERHLKEWELVDKKRAALISKSLWTPADEAQYQADIQPLARVVHADREAA